MIWRSRRHNGSAKLYNISKEAHNQVTGIIINSNRSYEHNLTYNMKPESKSLYAYVRRLQQDKENSVHYMEVQ